MTTSDERPSTVHCQHGEACGACAWLGVRTLQQLGRKRRLLGKGLKRYHTLAKAELLSCLASPLVEQYRNRAKMAVGLAKGDRPFLPLRGKPVRLGYFRSGTREITDAPHCRVLIPEILETSRALRGLLSTRASIPRELRHVDIRCGTDPGRQHLILVLRADKLPRLPIEAIRDACSRVDGISVNLNPSAGPQVLKGPISPIWGAREVYVETAGLSLRVSPGAFFQVNLSVLPEIHRTMAEFLDGGDVLADLYSGVGTHGLVLSRTSPGGGQRFRRVVCVEGVRSAVADAKATIQRHRLTDVEVIAKPVERALGPLIDARADSVIMNPSRAGAKLKVLEALAASEARKIVYLSCNPATLCRDLDFLVASGFRLVSAQPIDMMPQTRQVEAIALLRR
ncbi:MAG: class I SAM-dependent RNA methyltransferase [bacterium]|nr:class I SAM-dependent RNA methyltransferase [bacterium]